MKKKESATWKRKASTGAVKRTILKWMEKDNIADPEKEFNMAVRSGELKQISVGISKHTAWQYEEKHTPTKTSSSGRS